MPKDIKKQHIKKGYSMVKQQKHLNEKHAHGLTRTEQDLLSEERTSLSEERTLLSYIRTALAVFGLGLILAKLEEFGGENTLWIWIAAVLFVIAILLVFEEFIRIKHLRLKRKELARNIYQGEELD